MSADFFWSIFVQNIFMEQLKGILYIGIGASSYGVLATFVKLANMQEIHTAGLTFSQYLFGFLVLSILSLFISRKQHSKGIEPVKANKNSYLKLILFGSSLGFTSSLYYLSIQYIPVSVAVTLLMQSIWFGLLYEAITSPKLITRIKIFGAIAIIIGTLLAVNIFDISGRLQWEGIALGILAAISFAITMATTNSVALELPTIVRSKYLVLGGLLATILFWNIQILSHFNFQDFITWGVFLGIFGTILPPLLFNQGFPRIGVGLGSIVASVELPVSVLSALILLNEAVVWMQWLGIIIILLSVVLINKKQFVRKSGYDKTRL